MCFGHPGGPGEERAKLLEGQHPELYPTLNVGELGERVTPKAHIGRGPTRYRGRQRDQGHTQIWGVPPRDLKEGVGEDFTQTGVAHTTRPTRYVWVTPTNNRGEPDTPKTGVRDKEYDN